MTKEIVGKPEFVDEFSNLDIEWFFKHLERNDEINGLNACIIRVQMTKERQIKAAKEENYSRRGMYLC